MNFRNWWWVTKDPPVLKVGIYVREQKNSPRGNKIITNTLINPLSVWNGFL